MVVALGYLHRSQIYYRDLKPENILIQPDGYIMLADFGLAKIKPENGEEPNSFCGTQAYLSPEMIIGSGHDHTLDWWGLGIVMYEMLIGIPPFYHHNQSTLFRLIKHGPVRWPDPEMHGISISPIAQDLITSLLEKDRKKRLGQQGDSEEILSHPFFKGIDLDSLLKKKIQAEFTPLIDETGLNNFDQNITKQSPVDSLIPQENIAMILQAQEQFKEFSYSEAMN